MKKGILVGLCVLVLVLVTACRGGNAGPETGTTTSTTATTVGTTTSTETTATTSTQTQTRVTTTTAPRKSTTITATTTTTTTGTSPVSSRTRTTTETAVTEVAFEDIVCEKTADFQRVGFSVKGTNVVVYAMIPKDWKLQKNKNGYDIINKTQTIGSIATSEPVYPGSYNVFSGDMTNDGLQIIHSVDCIYADKDPSYIRTLCYKYDENKKIVLTVPYESVDSSAVVTMMNNAEKVLSSLEKNMGVLQLQDNRKRVLILGNSFVSTSKVGQILQTMCGSDAVVEAHSRGYADVGTYAEDTEMLANIQKGNYSAVFMCGLYTSSDVADLLKLSDACEASNTKLAIFPAHNERRSMIDNAATVYPHAVLIDWKAEINGLISAGVAESHFCVNDSHKHSTPLAGYVGAHMIYRAIFGKIPQTTSFDLVTPSQIALLGDYVTTGSIALVDPSTTYAIG